MRHPFWILNSALLLFFFIALDFIFFSRYQIPLRKSISPEQYIKPVTKEITEVNIEKIYENDLFKTYTKELSKPERSIVPIITMPQPPPPHQVTIPQEPKPQFLEPLNINLKGTILISDDETKNRAIIADEETNKEKMYKIGDVIEDARLIRILHNKVILARSNGQQEIIYLREKDTKLDPLYATLSGWGSVLEKTGNNKYIIHPNAFKRRVTTLGQFIDLLDLTTVFKQGKSIGTRVGYLAENSLGLALGLQKGDIIIEINGIPATTTPNRVNIYRSIVSLKIDDTIKGTVLRGGHRVIITYTLKNKQKKNLQDVTIEESEQEKTNIIQQQYKLAPTANELRIKEREIIRKQNSPIPS